MEPSLGPSGSQVPMALPLRPTAMVLDGGSTRSGLVSSSSPPAFAPLSAAAVPTGAAVADLLAATRLLGENAASEMAPKSGSRGSSSSKASAAVATKFPQPTGLDWSNDLPSWSRSSDLPRLDSPTKKWEQKQAEIRALQQRSHCMHDELRQVASWGSGRASGEAAPKRCPPTPPVLLPAWVSQAEAEGKDVNGSAPQGFCHERSPRPSASPLSCARDLKRNGSDTYLPAWKIDLPSDLASCSSMTASPRRQAEEIKTLRQELASEVALRKWGDADWRRRMKRSEDASAARAGDELEALRISERRRHGELAGELEELRRRLAQQHAEQQLVKSNGHAMMEERIEAVTRSHAAELALVNATWARRCADEASEVQQKADTSAAWESARHDRLRQRLCAELAQQDKSLESLIGMNSSVRHEQVCAQELSEKVLQRDEEIFQLAERLRAAERSKANKEELSEKVLQRDEEIAQLRERLRSAERAKAGKEESEEECGQLRMSIEGLRMSLEVATRLNLEWQSESGNLRRQLISEESARSECEDQLAHLERGQKSLTTSPASVDSPNVVLNEIVVPRDEELHQISELEEAVREWRARAHSAQYTEEALEHEMRRHVAQADGDRSARSIESEQTRLTEMQQLFTRQEGCLTAEIDMLLVENQVLRSEAGSCQALETKVVATARSAKHSSSEAAETKRCLDETLRLHSRDLEQVEERMLSLEAEWQTEVAACKKQVVESVAERDQEKKSAEMLLEESKSAERQLNAETMTLRSQLADARRRHGERLQAERRHAEKQEDSLQRRVRQLEEAERSAGKMMSNQLSEDMEIMGELRQRADDLLTQLVSWQDCTEHLRGSCEAEYEALPSALREEIAEALPKEIEQCCERLQQARKSQSTKSRGKESSAASASAWCAAVFRLVAKHAALQLQQTVAPSENCSCKKDTLREDVALLRQELLELQDASLDRSPRKEGGRRLDLTRARDNARLEDKINLLQASLRAMTPSAPCDADAITPVAGPATKASESSARKSPRLRLADRRVEGRERRNQDCTSRTEVDSEIGSATVEGDTVPTTVHADQSADDSREAASASTSRGSPDKEHASHARPDSGASSLKGTNDIGDLFAELQEKQNELRRLELASKGSQHETSDIHSGGGNDSSDTIEPCNDAGSPSSVYPPSPPNTGRAEEKKQGNESAVKPQEDTSEAPDSGSTRAACPEAPTTAQPCESAAEVYARAEAFCEAQQFEDAVPLFRRVLTALAGQRDDAMVSVEAEVWACLGVAVQSMNDVEEAIESYRKAVQLDPSLHVCHANLATLYSHLEDAELAHTSIGKALSLQPSNEAYLEIRRSLPSLRAS